MARPRKKAADLTTEEALARMFPKKVVARVKKEAAKGDGKATKKDSS